MRYHLTPAKTILISNRQSTTSKGVVKLIFFLILFVCLFLSALSFHHCSQAFYGCNKWGLLSSCGAWASHCNGLSC